MLREDEGHFFECDVEHWRVLAPPFLLVGFSWVMGDTRDFFWDICH